MLGAGLLASAEVVTASPAISHGWDGRARRPRELANGPARTTEDLGLHPQHVLISERVSRFR